MVRARVALGLLALVVALLPAGAAAADVAWPDGVDPDVVQAQTVGPATVTSGGRHSCAITGAGALHCWGSDSDGQLGDGGGTADSAGAVAVRNASAMRIAVQVDAGDEHTCALTFEGRAYCWGDNSSGQLGIGAGEDEHAPVRVEAMSGRTLVEITTGANHTCAIDDDGALWCWGAGDKGQLGSGGTANSEVPVRVGAATGLTDPVVDVSAGHDTTCAATADGVAWCWGAGAEGQTGYGGTADRDVPVRVSTAGALDGVRVRQLTVGRKQACALDDDGRVACWGRTAAGDRLTPVAVTTRPLRQISAGGAGVCGVDSGAVVWCWGAAPQRKGITARDLDLGDEGGCVLDGRGVASCWVAAGAPVRISGLPRAPQPVTRVTVAPTDGGLRVTWRPVTDFGSGAFQSYLAVTTDFEHACEVTEATGVTCEIRELTNGEDYDVAVLTYADDGTAVSAIVGGRPGLAPAPLDPPTLAPGNGGGGLPITGPGPLIMVTIGLLLLGLGLSALLVRKGE